MSVKHIKHNDNYDTPKENRYLVFKLGQESFAIPLLVVREVLGIIPITSVPSSPPYFKGVMNLRDTVISVIDLGERLKIQKSQESSLDEIKHQKEKSIIILNHDVYSLGVIVDFINNVVSFGENEISKTPHLESHISQKYIQGVGRKDNQLILIIDVWQILGTEYLNLIEKKAA